MMKKLLFTVSAAGLLFTISLLFLLSCSNYGGSSDVEMGVSFGVITAKGSIFVNGIEFQTDDALITVDDRPANEDELKVGMFVRVEGEFYSDGTGNAATIIADNEVKGPIESIDLENGVLTVMGQTVLVDSSTVFADAMGLDNLSKGNIIEVHGIFNQNNCIYAGRVDKKAHKTLSTDNFEVSGRISDLDMIYGTFTIEALTVDYMAELAILPPGGIHNGDFVEVEGYLVSGTLVANEIEREDEFDFDYGDKFEIEGIVTSVVHSENLTQFGINGTTVVLTSSTIFEKCDAADLAVGIKVEVEGEIDDNRMFIAHEISVKELSKKKHFPLKIKAHVDSINPENNTLTFFNGAVTVLVTDIAQLKDKKGGTHLEFQDIFVGDFLDIKGVQGSNSDIDASKLKRKKGKHKSMIQGPVDQIIPFSSITILGVSIHIGVEVEFENDDSLVTAETFFDSVQVGDIVKAKGHFDAMNGFIKAKEIEVKHQGHIPSPIPVNTITVNVINSDFGLNSSLVHVTLFKKGGNIPGDVIETKIGTLSERTLGGVSASVKLDNAGAGYEDGIYDIRAHIDFDTDGALSFRVRGADYITLGDVIIGGSSVDVTLDGPWGTYFPLNVEIYPPDDPERVGKNLYMILVSSSNTWGNYTYASESVTLPVTGEITVDGWGPFGFYSLHALIDMNGNFDLSSVGPDPGDYISSEIVSWLSGPFPKQQFTQWTQY